MAILNPAIVTRLFKYRTISDGQ